MPCDTTAMRRYSRMAGMVELVNVLYVDELPMALLAIATPFGLSDIGLARFPGITVSLTESP